MSKHYKMSVNQWVAAICGVSRVWQVGREGKAALQTASSIWLWFRLQRLARRRASAVAIGTYIHGQRLVVAGRQSLLTLM